ncbi:hypothetical protein SD457_18575 [Coprobacillaceae bacterium CR2/5/TPMF4]|nr:hypothetical protein SD457_18575 [Coprobacillaceae bacterium CR2/5/TPMF4]
MAIIGVVIAVVIIAVVIVLNLTRIQLMFKGYSFSQASEILSLTKEEENEILAHDKMDHIVNWIEESDNVEWYDEYERYLGLNKKLEYADVVSYVDNLYETQVPKLKSLSYSNDDIWKLIEDGASEDDFQYLIDNNYSANDLEPYSKVEGYKIQNLAGYISAYATYKDYNYAVCITNYPFIISSNGDPQDSYTISNPDELLTLVKKVSIYQMIMNQN